MDLERFYMCNSIATAVENDCTIPILQRERPASVQAPTTPTRDSRPNREAHRSLQINDGSSVKNPMRRCQKSPGSQPAAKGASICVGETTELAHTAPAPMRPGWSMRPGCIRAQWATRGSSARPARTCGEHQHTQSQLWENRAGLRFLGVC